MTGELERLFRRLHDADDAVARAAAVEVGARARDAGRPVLVVSACLLGARARYDGAARPDRGAQARARDAALLPLCPELLAGCGCPRPPMWYEEGDGATLLAGAGLARDATGADAAPALLRGARRTAALARAAGAGAALLKERSPSCGVRQVHTATGPAAGRGAAAAALAAAGLQLESDEGGGRDGGDGA